MCVEDYLIETKLNQWIGNLIVEMRTNLWKTELKSTKSHKIRQLQRPGQRLSRCEEGSLGALVESRRLAGGAQWESAV